MLASAGGSRQSTIEEIGAFRDDKQHGTPGAIWTQPAAAPAVLVGCWLTNRQSGEDMDHPVRIAEHISWVAETWFAETCFAGNLVCGKLAARTPADYACRRFEIFGHDEG